MNWKLWVFITKAAWSYHGKLKGKCWDKTKQHPTFSRHWELAQQQYVQQVASSFVTQSLNSDFLGKVTEKIHSSSFCKREKYYIF